MKSLEELTVSVSAIEPKVILDQFQVAGRARRRARQLCRINTDLIAKKARTLYIPSRGQLTAYGPVTEGSETGGGTDQTVTYSTVTVTPAKYRVKISITQEQIDGSELDIINDIINEAGEALADKEDTVLLGVFTAAGAAGNTVSASVNGSLLYEDILAAKVAVVTDYFQPKVLVVNQNQESDLLKDTRFTDLSKYGEREPILNGEIGKIAGLKIVTTENLTSGTALCIDTDKAVWMAIKRNVELKKDDSPQLDSIVLYFYQEYGAAMINANAVAVITGC